MGGDCKMNKIFALLCEGKLLRVAAVSVGADKVTPGEMIYSQTVEASVSDAGKSAFSGYYKYNISLYNGPYAPAKRAYYTMALANNTIWCEQSGFHYILWEAFNSVLRLLMIGIPLSRILHILLFYCRRAAIKSFQLSQLQPRMIRTLM
jgi:hypothetical protein